MMDEKNVLETSMQLMEACKPALTHCE